MKISSVNSITYNYLSFDNVNGGLPADGDAALHQGEQTQP